jgi:hypothetical protein
MAGDEADEGKSAHLKGEIFREGESSLIRQVEYLITDISIL